MDFGGLLDGLGGLGGGKGSNNIFIWVVLLVIIFGFGKGRNILIAPPPPPICEPKDEKHKCRHHSKELVCQPPPPGGLFSGGLFSGGFLGQNGLFGNGGFLGGNGLFILIIIGLLFLCKDPKNEDIDEDASCECEN